jgi:site-specific DNA recombinase
MNALFLKDLAQKTHRRLRGRVEAGYSGGGDAYGYRVFRRLGTDGNLTTGKVSPAPTGDPEGYRVESRYPRPGCRTG